jgi:hypothetical protein
LQILSACSASLAATLELIVNEKRIHLHRIDGIPDPADRILAAACGGDVRKLAFNGTEQLLRMIAAFPDGAIRVGIRMTYTPGLDPQSRLEVELAMVTSGEGAEETIDRLAHAGPLSTAYTLKWNGCEPASRSRRLLRSGS